MALTIPSHWNVGTPTAVDPAPHIPATLPAEPKIWPRYPDLIRHAKTTAHNHNPAIHVIDPLQWIEQFKRAPRNALNPQPLPQLKPNAILTGATARESPGLLTLIQTGRLYESSCLTDPFPRWRYWVKTAETLKQPADTWGRTVGLPPNRLCLPEPFTLAANNFMVLHHELWHAALPVARDQEVDGQGRTPALPTELSHALQAGASIVIDGLGKAGHNPNRPAISPEGQPCLLKANIQDYYRDHVAETVADCGALLDMAQFELRTTGRLCATPALIDTFHDLRAAAHVRNMLMFDTSDFRTPHGLSYATHMAMPYLRIRLHELALSHPEHGRQPLLDLDALDLQQEAIQCALNGLQPNEFTDMLVGAGWLYHQARYDALEFDLNPLGTITHLRRLLTTQGGIEEAPRLVCDEILAKGQGALERLDGGRLPTVNTYGTNLRERADYIGPDHIPLLISHERARLGWLRDHPRYQHTRADTDACLDILESAERDL